MEPYCKQDQDNEQEQELEKDHEDGHTDEVVVGILIVLLVVYTFCRLLHVWAHTLNFSEVDKITFTNKCENTALLPSIYCTVQRFICRKIARVTSLSVLQYWFVYFKNNF